MYVIIQSLIFVKLILFAFPVIGDAGEPLEVRRVTAPEPRCSSFLKGGYVHQFDANIDAGVMFAETAAEEPRTQVLGRRSSEPSEQYATMDSLFALYQPYLVNLVAYEPMYFLVGTNPKKSKFQISFKYRFLDPEGTSAEELPWLKGLHFGYTQTSFWDLKSDSAPFEDTSYKPELFFLSSNIKRRPSWMQGFFLQTGFQHESNGRGGEFSRSTNYLYAKPIFILYSNKNQLGLQIAPKVWTYVNNDNDTNPDLEDYRGFFDLEVKLGKADSFVLESHLRWGNEGVSTQWDLTYPLHQHVFRYLGFYLQVQYVNALAESLIDYQERTEALRLGLAIVR
jgi:outer membrane phospholipase A